MAKKKEARRANGAQGPRGANGAPGPRGATGATGRAGRRGKVGRPGRRGPRGSAGPEQDHRLLEIVETYFADVYKQLDIQLRRISTLQLAIDELNRRFASSQ